MCVSIPARFSLHILVVLSHRSQYTQLRKQQEGLVTVNTKYWYEVRGYLGLSTKTCLLNSD
nr:unnamed protein product [Callosobruchus analis]